MGDARKTAAASDGILDQIASALIANDHEFRMARKVEQLVSSAAPGLGSMVQWEDYGQLRFDDDVVVEVEPIDRQGRPVPTSPSCACFVDHPEVFDLAPKTEFPVLRTVPADGPWVTRYVHFAHYDTTRMARMAGYSYDEIEADHPTKRTTRDDDRPAARHELAGAAPGRCPTHTNSCLTADRSTARHDRVQR